jgi:hypothetical protein
MAVRHRIANVDILDACCFPESRRGAMWFSSAGWRGLLPPLYEVNPKIRADWRDWNPLARQR